MRDRDVLYCFLWGNFLFFYLFFYFSISDGLNYKGMKLSHSAMEFEHETISLTIKVIFCWARSY